MENTSKEEITCNNCSHTIQQRRKFGFSLRCAEHEDFHDVTVSAREKKVDSYCPLRRYKKKSGENMEV